MDFITRTISISAAVGAALLATAPARAGDTTPLQVVVTAPVASGSSADAGAEALHAIGFKTEYRMSDGARMVLQPRAGSIRMHYGSRGAVTLHADDDGRFVSDDGQLTLTVVALDGDAAGQVRLSRPARW